jgi:hypothetical protein
MPRFVVLTHDFPTLHWDFMLEHGDALRTWRLARAPLELAPVAAEALPDHRLHYLDYEGPVSGNRGEVRRWDAGEFTWEEATERQVRVRLAGQRLRGTATLVAAGGRCLEWEFYFEAD